MPLSLGGNYSSKSIMASYSFPNEVVIVNSILPLTEPILISVGEFESNTVYLY